MLRAVPSGKSFFGCGTTTTIPPFLNLWCEPLTLTSLKPSALRRLTISWLLRGMRNNIHTAAVQPQPAQRTAHLMKPVTDPKTTRLYDRHSHAVTIGDVERIRIQARLRVRATTD